jgi:hypothetical protein
MRNLSAILFLFVAFLTACGPASEDRQLMHERAKHVQDSIADYIHARMAEAEAPGPMNLPPPAAPQATNAVSPNPNK